MIEIILDRCLEEIHAKRATVAECLARYPDLGELGPLLEMALAIERVPDVTPSDEFRRQTRERLLHAADPEASRTDTRADRAPSFGDDPAPSLPAHRPAQMDT
jgi:hypothetical protein